MKKFILISFTVLISIVNIGCVNKQNNLTPTSLLNNSTSSTNNQSSYDQRIQVVINEIPYNTDKYFRIPYTIKFWDYKKENLVLKEIEAFNSISQKPLYKFDQKDFGDIMEYPEPIIQSGSSYSTGNALKDIYLSIQIPLLLTGNKPEKIYHKITFTNTGTKQDLTIQGGEFKPRLNESPRIISSPLKGKNLILLNQSSMGYHFYVLFFKDNKIFRGERFAFDSLKFDDDYNDYVSSDPTKNESYHNYKDTIYAVADGKITYVLDGMAENNGNLRNAAPTKHEIDKLAGNYIMQDIGSGHYAVYAHCVPGSIKVKPGDIIKEGQPIALLGNSGNSEAPHLHFQIVDDDHILFSNGVPFVLKEYIKKAEILGEEEITGIDKFTPTKINNSMMEPNIIIDVE